MVEEFEKAEVRPEFKMPPPIPFPEHELTDDQVLDEVREILGKNPYEIEKNFGVSYVGPPHPISRRVAELAAGTFFVEWAGEMQPGPMQFEREAVRMMASLLGKPDAVGFITNGGTESNISAMRLARNLASVSRPEIIMPESGHYSFRAGAELLGITLREAPLGDDHMPDMDYVESLVNDNTVALVCTAPGGAFGLMDPVEEFAELAQRKGVYLHVDGAFGGFFLPFMRELGRDVPPFDFTLPGVSSIMTDGHKLGMMPVSTGFFLVRDEEMLQAIPTEDTMIHNLTATKNGERAATAWAVLRRLGREGYREAARHVLEIVDFISDGVKEIEGLRLVVPPFITLVSITSDVYDMGKVHQEMLERGWGHMYGTHQGIEYIRLSVHQSRDMEHARQFLRALEDSVDAVRAQM
ncbi:MAG: aminotransferase class V-fold PLP-dependent enzyme [Chloroflexi bacterium]|nr:aminotransferase class V-fold PLP-dependent enzyme [Chloroflexota bacterium]